MKKVIFMDLDELIKKNCVIPKPELEPSVEKVTKGSANGQFVAQVHNSGHYFGNPASSIVLYNANARKMLNWASRINPYTPIQYALSNNGKIAFAQEGILHIESHVNKDKISEIDTNGFFNLNGEGRIISISISIDGNFIAIYSTNGYIYLYNRAGTLRWKYHLFKSYSIKLEISHDGNYIVVAEIDPEGNSPFIYFFNCKDGKLLWKYQLGDVLYDFKVSSNCERIAVSSIDKNIYVLDREGNLLGKYFTDSKDLLLANCVATAEKDAYIVVFLEGKNELFLLNQFGKKLWSRTLPEYIHKKQLSLTISGSGNYIIAGSGGYEHNPNIFLINRDNTNFISSHFSDGINYLMLSDDGNQIVIESNSHAAFIVQFNELLQQVVREESKKISEKDSLSNSSTKIEATSCSGIVSSEKATYIKNINNDEPNEILCMIIKKHGTSLISNPSAFTGIIKDYFKGEYKKEVTVLVKSIEENVPQDLLAKKDKIPFAVQSGQFVQRLEDCGFSKELSIWAVDAWARALEISE